MAVAAKPKNDKSKIDPLAEEARRRSRYKFWSRIYRAPYWLFVFFLLWLFVVISINSNEDYRQAWEYVRGNYFEWITDTISCNTGAGCPEDYETTPPAIDGIVLTLAFAFVSYALALVIGLLIGIVRANPPTPPLTFTSPIRQLRSGLYVVLYNLLTFYVEFMRGIPSIVFILLAAFVILPAARDALNEGIIANLGLPEIRIRSIDPIMGILSLAIIYSAYLSEVFRAGIQAIGKGQIEAARSLGMTYFQTMRLIVVPQAIRAVLPPLGNDFIAIIKDTALLTILGVNDITQLSRKWVGTSFKYPETFLVLSMIYLTMTVIGSLLVQLMERMLRRHER
jgi:polar amino acid transport system permease protein